MGYDWLDELGGRDPALDDDSLGAFYCPYTNTSECALLSEGWEPQELCEAIECDQLKFFQRRPRRRRKAA